jgi:hypothetical protein
MMATPLIPCAPSAQPTHFGQRLKYGRIDLPQRNAGIADTHARDRTLEPPPAGIVSLAHDVCLTLSIAILPSCCGPVWDARLFLNTKQNDSIVAIYPVNAQA